ncbi:MAG TPA: type I-C CRISPR-associated protein Cas5c [Candidatus Obscuribacterales bacterium]
MSVNNAIKLRVWGDFACFTRPEMKVERVSYEVMTPSAARNILQCILWKPSFDWVVTQIDVLKPIRWALIRRNEVGQVIPMGSATSAMKSGTGRLALYVEDDRQQRAGLLLRDVEYLIHAQVQLTHRASADENIVKFIEIFKRRAEKGQCFTQPYLGCREFTAYFELVNGDSTERKPIEDSKDLGWMLHDLDFTGEEVIPGFFHAHLQSGRLLVPRFDSQEICR